jgi:hypothetical protein
MCEVIARARRSSAGAAAGREVQCRSAYTRNEMASAERFEEKRVMMSRG